LGRVEDVIVRLGGVGYPPITGLLVKVAGRTSYLGIQRVSDIGVDGAVLKKAKLDLRRFERREEEVLLGRDVLDRQLINVEGARLVRANEIELADIAGSWRVVGVDTGPRGGLRRLLPKPLGRGIATGDFLDWASVEPFVGHVPTVRLRIPHPKLAKLHPAQIADLVEAASRREGEEIIQAVGEDDRELEADVFEELDDHHQREFLEDRPDEQVAEILARMAPDDAADAAGELDEQRRERILALLPVSHRVKVRALLGYDPAEAGGLMSPEFISLRRSTSAAEALDAVHLSTISPELLTAVFVTSPEGSLDGSVPLATLLRAEPDRRLSALVKHELPSLRADASFEEVARLMADYNLTCVPVVDERERMLGVVTVDDVLEAMLPRGWRRRFGLLGED
jgi:MgtE intracellular N domain/CBS domain